MWNFHLRGTRYDLWATCPPHLAQTIFSSILQDSLLGLMQRYARVQPSFRRIKQYRYDLTAILLCVLDHLLWACNSVSKLLDPGHGQLPHYSIHNLASNLLAALAALLMKEFTLSIILLTRSLMMASAHHSHSESLESNGSRNGSASDPTNSAQTVVFAMRCLELLIAETQQNMYSLSRPIAILFHTLQTACTERNIKTPHSCIGIQVLAWAVWTRMRDTTAMERLIGLPVSQEVYQQLSMLADFFYQIMVFGKAISFAKKANPVFIPSGWDIIVRMARRTNPYTVIPIRYTQILDFKYLASQIIRNTKVDKNNKRVSWFKMKVIHFCKGQDTMHFKYGFDDSEYHQLCLSSSSARRRQPDLAHIIRPRYTEKLPVSEAKKQDLLSLCRSGVIPEDHHPFYENLPTASSKVDRLEEPDVEDVIEETD
nr:hypothetical protein BaRGS_006118 [Batillaria attramentaria]